MAFAVPPPVFSDRSAVIHASFGISSRSVSISDGLSGINSGTLRINHRRWSNYSGPRPINRDAPGINHRTSASYRYRPPINADGSSSVIFEKAQDTADETAVSCRNRVNTAEKSAAFFPDFINTDEKSAVICAEREDAAEKSAVICRRGITTEGKSAVSALRSGVRWSRPVVHAFCGFSHGLVYGGGSPCGGKAESRSGRQTCPGTPTGSICQSGEAPDDDEGARFTGETERD